MVSCCSACSSCPRDARAILAYTMPIWSVMFALALLHERLSMRKVAGMAFGMAGMAVLLGDDIRNFQRTPMAALLILGAAVAWAFGTVLLRKWKLPIPQNTLSGWMMLLGCAPLVVAGAVLRDGPRAGADAERTVRDPLQHLSRRHARALGVVHARPHAARGDIVDVVAAGADRRRVCRHAGPGRAARALRVDRAGPCRHRDDPGVVAAESGAGADGPGRLDGVHAQSSGISVGSGLPANHASRLALHKSPIA